MKENLSFFTTQYNAQVIEWFISVRQMDLKGISGTYVALMLQCREKCQWLSSSWMPWLMCAELLCHITHGTTCKWTQHKLTNCHKITSIYQMQLYSGCESTGTTFSPWSKQNGLRYLAEDYCYCRGDNLDVISVHH